MIRHFAIGRLCLILSLSIDFLLPLARAEPKESVVLFDASWSEEDGRVNIAISNMSNSDLFFMISEDNTIEGSMTYLDKGTPPVERNRTTSMLAMSIPWKLKPIYGKGTDDAGRFGILHGHMQFSKQDVSEIKEIRYRLLYCFLSDLKRCETYNELADLMRPWRGVAKKRSLERDHAGSNKPSGSAPTLPVTPDPKSKSLDPSSDKAAPEEGPR